MHKIPIFFLNKKLRTISIKSETVPVRIGSAEYWFDGCGAINGTLVRSTEDLKNLSIKDVDIKENFLKCSGSFCLFERKDSALNIYPDPIGGCLLYLYEDPLICAASSDLNGLAKFLKDEGVKLTASVHYLGLLLKIGNGAYGHSSFNEIKVINARSYLTISPSAARVIEYFSLDDFDLGEKAYYFYKENALDDLEKNIDAVRRSSVSQVICHLTGGFDSRLVAGALNKCNFADKVHFFCSGPAKTIDKQIASFIADRYGWALTDDSGLVSALELEPTILEKIRLGIEFSSGMRSTCSVNATHETRKDHLILSGGYGECYRSFYGHKIESLDNQIWKHQNLIEIELNQEIERETKEYILNITKNKTKLDQALDFMYVENRNRYYVGNIATLFSRKTPRFDPLYSLNAIFASLSLSLYERRSNRLGYEVMNQLDRSLLGIGFNSKKFGSEVMEKDSFVASVKVTQAVSPTVIRKAKARKAPTTFNPADVAYSEKIKATPWQVANYDLVRKDILENIEKIECTGNINPIYIKSLIERSRPANRVALRDTYSLWSFLNFINSF